MCKAGSQVMKSLCAGCLVLSFACLLQAQLPTAPVAAEDAPQPTATAAPANATSTSANAMAGMDQLLKRVDDVLWFTRLSNIAEVDKAEYTSLPPAHPKNQKAPGATNPVIIHAYTFIPKGLDRTKKQPLIVFAHQGVHANFDTSDLHVIRELIEQGYCVIASDYRGSTGYGRNFYELIDLAAVRLTMSQLAPNGCWIATASSTLSELA